MIEKLKQAFEGKTVVKVEPSSIPESIAKFSMSDGTSFRLHATDLGFWLEYCENKDGLFPTLKDCLVSYGHHCYNTYCATEPEIKIENNILIIISNNKTEFKINVNNLNNWEKRLCNYPDLFAQAAALGEMYRSVFIDNNEVPEELRLKK